jgi:HK97 family phage portal protein
LLQRPHPQLKRFQFWDLWVSWLMLRGEAFIVPYYAGNGRGRTRRLIVLCPDHFQHVVENNELMGWRYTGYGPEAPLESQVFLPEEVIHSRFPNPYNFWRGAGPNHVARLAASTDYASAQFMKGLMLNNADTGVIAYTDQQPSPEQREAIMAALRDRKRKAGTADRPLMLWGGFKIEKPGISSADMQFLDNRKFNRQEICAVFGVPQELLGFTEDANRSVGDAARLNFIENRITPLCEMLESDLEDLVGEYEAEGEELYAWFDLESLPVMQKARRDRIDSGVKLFGMGVPLNNINEILDLGLPGDLPHGDKAYLPFNLTEVGTKPKDGPKKPTNNEPKDPASKGIARILKMLEAGTPEPAIETPAPHQCGAQSEAYEASIAGSIKNKESKLRRYFFEQRGRVLANLNKLTKVLADIEAKAFDDVFDEGAENADLLSKMKPLLGGRPGIWRGTAFCRDRPERFQGSTERGDSFPQFAREQNHGRER